MDGELKHWGCLGACGGSCGFAGCTLPAMIRGGCSIEACRVALLGEYIMAEAVDLIERVIGGGVKFDVAAGLPLSLIRLGESNLMLGIFGGLAGGAIRRGSPLARLVLDA